MPFAVGQSFVQKTANNRYTIYDVVGKENGLPSETQTIYLTLTSRASILSNAQQFITITGRELLNFFMPVVSK